MRFYKTTKGWTRDMGIYRIDITHRGHGHYHIAMYMLKRDQQIFLCSIDTTAERKAKRLAIAFLQTGEPPQYAVISYPYHYDKILCKWSK